MKYSEYSAPLAHRGENTGSGSQQHVAAGLNETSWIIETIAPLTHKLALQCFTIYNMDWKSVSTHKCCYWGSATWLSVQAVKSTHSSTQRVPLAVASFHPVAFNHVHRRFGSIFLPSGPRPHSSSAGGGVVSDPSLPVLLQWNICNNWIFYFINMLMVYNLENRSQYWMTSFSLKRSQMYKICHFTVS